MSHENDPNDPKVEETSEVPEQNGDAITDEQLDGSVGAGYCYGEIGYENN